MILLIWIGVTVQHLQNHVIILFHGLEGHGQRPYITGAALHFNEQNMDAICVNFRCCSGELNKYYTTYHSGKTDDVEDIIKHVVSLNKYDSIFLKGISLGGNILLKYLGDGSMSLRKLKLRWRFLYLVIFQGQQKHYIL